MPRFRAPSIPIMPTDVRSRLDEYHRSAQETTLLCRQYGRRYDQGTWDVVLDRFLRSVVQVSSVLQEDNHAP